jgi:hypothetical protein
MTKDPVVRPRRSYRSRWARPFLEQLEDRRLLSTFVVENTNAVGQGSLFLAMAAANQNPGPDIINFNIPGDGVHTIAPTFGLPPITDAVIIDGRSQPGWSIGKPVIELDGQSAGAFNGLELQVGGNTVQGLIINNFPLDGIVLAELGTDNPTGNNFILGNFIGTDATGTVAKGNHLAGIHIVHSPHNHIGSTDPVDINVISGNRESGIFIQDKASTDNHVEGNFIGTVFGGMKPLGNGLDGIFLGAPATGDPVDGFASGNFIGAADPGALNVISGNGHNGVNILRGTGNIVQGNYIGVGLDGKTPIANGARADADGADGNGVLIEEGDLNLIGGTADNAGNVISANKHNGVKIVAAGDSALGNRVQGNRIGTDKDGMFSDPDGKANSGDELGNVLNGVQIGNKNADSLNFAIGNVIGGADEDDGVTDGNVKARNIISGNLQDGILLVGDHVDGNQVEGNFIGTDKNGELAVKNVSAGIRLETFTGQVLGPTRTMIGDTRPMAGNVISGNGEDGVAILFGSRTSISSNLIGTRSDGLRPLGNGFDGVLIASSANTVGGSSAAARNVIAASGNVGVVILGQPNQPVPSGNVVAGNYIGTDKSGNVSDTDGNAANGNDLGNRTGVVIQQAAGNTVGGLLREDGNIIGGSLEDGLDIDGAGANNNTVTNNLIGVGKLGFKLGNLNGVRITGTLGGGSVSGNQIGGTTLVGAQEFGLGNVISANRSSGVRIDTGASGNFLVGNFIGTDFNGATVLGNGEEGVAISNAASNTIGGTTAAFRNVIVNNGHNGVLISGPTARSNVLLGNHIGFVDGVGPAANTFNGVLIDDAPGNFIGQSVKGGRNVISGNTLAGVRIQGEHGAGNQVVGNFIGTTPDGDAEAANGEDGVSIADGASTNSVGEPGDLGRNVISGNKRSGLLLEGSKNVVRNNYFGLKASGLDSLPNEFDGVRSIEGAGNIIGDGTPGARNVISGNIGVGVRISGNLAIGNSIKGNYIGTDKDSAKRLGNEQGGVSIQDAGVGEGHDPAAQTTIDSNVIAGNFQGGIRLAGGTHDNHITNNFIGTNSAGNSTITNFGVGVFISESPNNFIGGPTLATGNVIDLAATLLDPDPEFGAGGEGILVIGIASKQNHITNNTISNNASSGIEIKGGASVNLVGEAGAGNVIINNVLHGVFLHEAGTSHNLVQGNFIGIFKDGNPGPNHVAGVLVGAGASDNTIGGTSEKFRNVISANQVGIQIQVQANSNAVQGNFIGTDLAGNFQKNLGNTTAGIRIVEAQQNEIGGETDTVGSPPGNTIVGNAIGVDISSSGCERNVIQGNLITNNTGPGVRFSFNASNNTVGGAKKKDANLIKENGKAGVFVESGTGNSILHNQIFGNDGLAIDLGPDEGETLNDSRENKDRDEGPNNLQNFPVLTFATTGGSHLIVGKLASAPSTTYTIEFFAGSKDPANPTLRFLTSTTVTTNQSGIGLFPGPDENFPDPGPAGTVIFATATDPDGNTSEYSQEIEVDVDTDGDGIPDRAEDVGPNGGSGTDNIPDKTQPNVATFPDALNGRSPITLVAPAGKSFQHVTPRENPSPDDSPNHFLFKFILFDFNISGVAPGEHVVIQVILPASAPHYYFRYGKTPDNPFPHWFDWTYDKRTDTGADFAGNIVTLHVVNGARGDDDLDANNDRIVDTGGPGFPDEFTVVNTLDSGDGSLRQAVLNANASPGADEITFNILDPGPLSIHLLSPLPAITEELSIDGFTQPGFSGMPLIELDGSQAGPAADGLVLNAASSIIRGLVINRFSGDGVRLASGGSDTLEGNFIGTDFTGTIALGNGAFGVEIGDSASSSIGSSNLNGRNVISGNLQGGISIQGNNAKDNLLSQNLIGTQVDGSSPLGNLGPGVLLDTGANSNRIGSGALDQGNTIAFNTGPGVDIRLAQANLVRGNAIFANGGLGIDLGGDGVTTNDADDSDTGGNALQNFPVLTHVASYGGRTYLTGSLISTPDSSFTLDFYTSATADSSGFGEGKAFLDKILVSTDSAGLAAFDLNLEHLVVTGTFVTATATNADGATSEFSAVIQVPTSETLFFTVNTTDDVNDAVPDPAHLSLREAILLANSHPGADFIRFNISGQNRTISPLSPLPDITDPVTIDGASQPGFAGLPLIELEGSQAGIADGLRITGGGSVVRGLVINRFHKQVAENNGGGGIVLQGLGGNRIEGNFIDTDVTGTNALPNEFAGVFVHNSPDNLIGGTSAAARNVVIFAYLLGSDTTGNHVEGNYFATDMTGTVLLTSNEFGGGIVIDSAPSNTIGGLEAGAGNLIGGGLRIFGSGNVVQGNLIGTDATGTIFLTHGAFEPVQTGVSIGSNASDNLIGGTTAAARNIIPAGVSIASNSNKVQGNYIGTDVTGTKPLGKQDGVSIGGNFNTIGGTTPGAGNLISGNNSGVFIAQFARFNVVQGNWIGTDVSGAGPLGNQTGVTIVGDRNTIGGSAPGAGNLISGNVVSGLRLIGFGTNFVQGNFIGTDRTGTKALGNGLNSSDGDGILVSEDNDRIGGSNPGEGNVISGNGKNGIHIKVGGIFPTGIVISGNYIGTDLTGTLPLGNGAAGISIEASRNNRIGGKSPGAGNVISANGGGGLVIFDSTAQFPSTGIVVQGNKIGTDVTGTRDLGNAGDGVSIITSSYIVSNDIVGGTDQGAGNVIAFNGGNGVSALFGTGNAIRDNAIFANAGLGIVTDINGVLSTYAEARSLDLLQNAPVLTSAVFDTQGTVLTGTLAGTPDSRYEIDFFANDDFDPSGFGEGQTFLESLSVQTDETGMVQFRERLELAVPAGRWITATATDPAGNTSQFSRAIPVSASTEPGTVQFAAPAYVVTENGLAAVVVVTRSGSSAGTVSVDYQTADGTAKAGTDYTSQSGTLTFNDSETSKILTIPILGDGTPNGDRDFQILLSNPSNVSLGGVPESVVTIADEDGAGQVDFGSSTVNIAEGAQFTLPVMRTGGSHGRITIDYRVTAGTATPLVNPANLGGDASKFDYMDFFGTLTFEDGQTIAGITFTAFADDPSFSAVFEGPETIEVTLGNPTGGATLGSITTTVVTMRDDDDLDGGFTISVLGTPEEGRPPVLVGVFRSGNLNTTESVDFATHDGTAKAGVNYQAVTGTVTFLPGERQQVFTVPILDDLAEGPPGTFQVILSNPTGGAIFNDGQDRADVAIQERESAGRFVVGTLKVHEVTGGQVIFIERRDGARGVATVDFATSDGTASAGADYTATSGTVTFNSGENIKSITIPILGDALIEGDETFFVNLSNPTGGATIGDDSPAAVTIFETPGQFQFSSTDYRVAESNAGFTVVVTLAGPVSFDEPFTVDYTVHDGSAHAGADYTASSGTLTFALSHTRQTITIPILNDSLVEGDETIVVTLSNATGGPTVGELGTANLTILDEDAQRSQAQVSPGGPYTIPEGAELTLSAVIENGTPQDFSWDVNGDGVFGDAVGPNPLLSADQLRDLGIVDGASTFQVRVRATDSPGQEVISEPTSLTIVNVAPTATLDAPGDVVEGGTATVALIDPFDPGTLDTSAGFHYAFAVDGASLANATYANSGTSASHDFAFADGPSDHGVVVRIFDKDGGAADFSATIHVTNVPPTLVISGAAAIDAGALYTLELSSADAGQDVIASWSIQWGDGTVDTLLGNPDSATHVYLNGSLEATIRASAQDEDGTFEANSLAVSVRGQSGVLVAHGLSLQSFEFSPFSDMVASFTDSAGNLQGADFSAVIDWGDGILSSGRITANGSGTFVVSGDHTYLDEGNFTVQVVIVDKAGNSAPAQSKMVTLEELLPDGSRGTPDERYISEIYRDMLRRHVESAGLAFWNGLLDRGVARAQVALGIINSTPEYHTGVVEDMYQLYLHRTSDPMGLQNALTFLNAGGSQEQLATRFVCSSEYDRTRAGGTNTGFLNALYQDALNRSIDSAASKTFSDQLAAEGVRSEVADLIFASEEYRVDLVRNIYLRYLDREVEPNGLAIWTGLKKTGISDDYLLAQILGETNHHEFYDKTRV